MVLSGSETPPEETAEIGQPTGSGERQERRPEQSNRPKIGDLNIVVGRRMSGKTYFTIHGLLPKYSRIVIYDPNFEYPGIFFHDINPLIDWVENHKNGVFRVRMSDPNHFYNLATVAFNYPGTCFCADESWRALNPRRDLDEDFQNLVFRGRHRNCHLMLVSQRAQKIHIDVRSQYSNIYAFKQTHPRDIKVLEDESGEILSDLPNLELGQYYHISLNNEIEINKFKK